MTSLVSCRQQAWNLFWRWNIVVTIPIAITGWIAAWPIQSLLGPVLFANLFVLGVAIRPEGDRTSAFGVIITGFVLLALLHIVVSIVPYPDAFFMATAFAIVAATLALCYGIGYLVAPIIKRRLPPLWRWLAGY
jgi:hypothetical protein